MSNDDKARAAAAQLVIDDEPDDWCVAVAEIRG
jgi:cytochrome c oxidase assembly factor 4